MLDFVHRFVAPLLLNSLQNAVSRNAVEKRQQTTSSGIKRSATLEQRKKHFLRDVFSYRSVTRHMNSETVNRPLMAAVHSREGFFVPLQYPRQELVVALAHLLVLGRLCAAYVYEFHQEPRKVPKKRGRAARRQHILRKAYL